ncbi:MAG TPA: alpha-L-fucosidase [Terriglobia bacterium]|nr:alpha-L-fucosidase [Terriglobia bacterium]
MQFKTSVLLVLIILSPLNLVPTRGEDSKALSKASLTLPPEDLQWWREARFGMFVHWGVYAIPGRGEWVMWNERIPFREYSKLADRFNPRKFDASRWAAIAKSAGMKYMVVTTKHHDGFCLFDSEVSNFTSTKTAARRDFIAEYVKAARQAGLGVGFYYSPLDWRFPGFFFPDLYRENAEAMKQQTYDQIRELMSRYGKIDILWYDGGEDDWLGFGGIEYRDGKWQSRDTKWPQEKRYSGKPLWEPEKLNGMVRQLQPKIIINDRSGWKGDFSTPEMKVGEMNRERPWETCYTLAGSWGWTPGNPPLSLRESIHLLSKVVCRDGNLLLNVGPDPEGEIEAGQVERLQEIGQWLDKYGECIYKTRGGPFQPTASFGSTYHQEKVYLHILDWPENTLVLPGIPHKIISSTNLTGKEAQVSQTGGSIKVTVSVQDRQSMITIVKLVLDAPVDVYPSK